MAVPQCQRPAGCGAVSSTCPNAVGLAQRISESCSVFLNTRLSVFSTAFTHLMHFSSKPSAPWRSYECPSKNPKVHRP
eukprot:641636-Pelagomonas_calceolata.AAC.12